MYPTKSVTRKNALLKLQVVTESSFPNPHRERSMSSEMRQSRNALDQPSEHALCLIQQTPHRPADPPPDTFQQTRCAPSHRHVSHQIPRWLIHRRQICPHLPVLNRDLRRKVPQSGRRVGPRLRDETEGPANERGEVDTPLLVQRIDPTFVAHHTS